MVIASMTSWCTPLVLFCVSNIIIVTLFIASKSPKTKYPNRQDSDHDHFDNNLLSFHRIIPRVSSFLERAKSINLSIIIPNIVTGKNLQPESLTVSKKAKYTSRSRLAQSIFFSCSYDNQPDSPRYPSNKPKPTIITESEDIFSSLSQVVPDRVRSVKISTPISEKLVCEKRIVVEVKKSTSEVRFLSDDEEAFDLRRPQSARARMNADDDAKAEKFISKFREQLKLQRIDSLGRYNDMLRRPS